MRYQFSSGLAAAGVFLLLATQALANPIPTMNQTLWFRADEGVTKDSSNFVSNWGDQASLQGTNDATQATSARRPLWVDNELNGHAVIRFDGDDTPNGDYLGNSSYTHGSDSASLFVVAKRNGAAGGSYHNVFIQTPNYTTATNFNQIYAPSSNELINNYKLHNTTAPTDPLDINSGVTFSDSQFTILNSNKDSAGSGSSEFFINATSVGTGTGDQTLSNNFFIGSWRDNSFNGDIAEIIMYNQPLSQADRELVEGSLAWKYGLQASLPAAHPYANFDPNVGVPEPATISLLGFGLLAFRKKRRRV